MVRWLLPRPFRFRKFGSCDLIDAYNNLQGKMQGMIYIADKLHKENKRLNKEIKKLYNLSVEKIYIKNGIKYFFVSNKKIYIEEINDYQLEKINEIVLASNDLYSNKKNSRVILKCLNNKYYFNYKNKILCYDS